MQQLTIGCPGQGSPRALQKPVRALANSWSPIRRAAGVPFILAILLTSTGCQAWGSNWHFDQVPLVRPTAAADQSLGIMQVRIDITNGNFSAQRYQLQTGVVRLLVTANGGPYTIAIDPLLSIPPLAADTTTSIELTDPNPGEYTMKLNEGTAGTAVLEVMPPGG